MWAPTAKIEGVKGPGECKNQEKKETKKNVHQGARITRGTMHYPSLMFFFAILLYYVALLLT